MEQHPKTSTLGSFPFLTPEEFCRACCSLVDRVEAAGGPGAIGWQLMELLQRQQSGAMDVLRIVKRIQVNEPDINGDDHHDSKITDTVGEVGEIEETDDDSEALSREPCSSAAHVEVEYNVIRSTTYQLPVLYFFLRSIPPNGPQGIDAVYHYLVPRQLRTVLGSVGVMGGISIDYHPTLGVPVHFVHPCNTGDALRDVGVGGVPTVESYLPLWLGLVGNCVNLHLPCELLARSNGIQT